MIDFSRNHFELFGLPARFRFDRGALDARLSRAAGAKCIPTASRRGSDAERRLALQSSARVNEAYRALKDPVERAQYLLSLHGVDAFDETDTQLPLDFLERQLERRERPPRRPTPATCARSTRSSRSARRDAARQRARLARCSTTTRPYAGARTRVRELTFLTKLADDIDAMLAALD